ncbi:IS5 family transposase [Streptomyces sp. NPDC001443]
MIRRHELFEEAWEFVRPLLPESLLGRKRLDDRTVLNGIVWKFRTGTAWRDVPERYGPWATLHTRFRQWALDGTFERMLRAAQARADAAGDVGWLMSVDSTVVRAHQHAAGARKGASIGSARPGRVDRLPDQLVIQQVRRQLGRTDLFDRLSRASHVAQQVLLPWSGDAPETVQTLAPPSRHPGPVPGARWPCAGAAAAARPRCRPSTTVLSSPP